MKNDPRRWRLGVRQLVVQRDRVLRREFRRRVDVVRNLRPRRLPFDVGLELRNDRAGHLLKGSDLANREAPEQHAAMYVQRLLQPVAMRGDVGRQLFVAEGDAPAAGSTTNGRLPWPFNSDVRISIVRLQTVAPHAFPHGGSRPRADAPCIVANPRPRDCGGILALNAKWVNAGSAV